MPWATMASMAAVIFAAPWLPSAANWVLHLASSFLAGDSGASRPGNGYFHGFYSTACLLPSIWAANLSYTSCAESPGFFPLTVSICMSALFISGSMAMWKNKSKSIPLSTIVLIIAALYAAMVMHYSYVAFKMTALAWPLMALILASGIYQLASAIAKKSMPVAVITVIILFVPQMVLSANLSRDFYSRVVEKDISTFRSIKEIESIVGVKPILYALPTRDPFLWGLLFLRHSVFDPTIFKNPFFRDAYRPEAIKSDTKADFVLTESSGDLSCQGHREVWRRGPYVLWIRDKMQSVAFVSTIQHPNGLDYEVGGGLAIWLGGVAAKVEIWSDTAVEAFLSIYLSPGPSLPETTMRTIIASQGKWSKSFKMSNPSIFQLPINLISGISQVNISVKEIPSVALLPNGDPRPLMVRLSAPSICSHPGTQ
jgi:hypothetical protein